MKYATSYPIDPFVSYIPRYICIYLLIELTYVPEFYLCISLHAVTFRGWINSKNCQITAMYAVTVT